MKRIISIIIALVAITIGTTAFGQSTTDTLKSATIKVSGISCNGDMPLIKKKLINQEGIDEVNFTEAKDGAVTFSVKYHSSMTTEKKIRVVIEAVPSCDNPNLYPFKTKTLNSKTKKQ